MLMIVVVPVLRLDWHRLLSPVLVHPFSLGTDGSLGPGIARQLLGPNAMIGATVSSVAEAVAAVEAGADYLGIGTIFATKT